MRIAFDNSYVRLPERFYARVSPTKVREPKLVKLNVALAATLGLDAEELVSPKGVEMLAGNVVPTGADPIAMAYAGHQFGHFVPQLGDGRAILLGEVVGKGGRWDVQLKGSGRTPFSRGGDGRAALGPVLREYVVSEAMTAMGVPSTRALAAVTTGEPVVRDRILPGAVLTRVASSHIRVGTFQFFAARQDREAVKLLASYALERHYPDAKGSGNDALALLERVTAAQADLVARWLGLGFVHGVMNTDNTSVSGETIDFGPCAFLDEYDPDKTFSSIDHGGRYSFSNQPRLTQWNLLRLAETLLPLLSDDEDEGARRATECIQRFPDHFDKAYTRIMRSKLGLGPLDDVDREREDDVVLVADVLERLARDRVDYTVFFRTLAEAASGETRDTADAELSAMFADSSTYAEWSVRWRARLARDVRSPAERTEAMRHINPAFIPRNHRVEEAIRAAMDDGDFIPFETLVKATSRPFDDQPELAHLRVPPRPEERVVETFCGT